MNLSTADLARAASRGDRAAFRELVRSHAQVVCAIVLSVTRDADSSEDVTQEVFAAAWKGLGRLRDPARFGPWLRQLARNRAHQFLRDERRRSSRVRLDDAAIAAARDPAAGVAEALVAAADRAALAAALAELPQDAREVVVLFYRQGRSVADVARQLDLSEPTVRKRLSRARDRLRDGVEARLSHLLLATTPGPDLLDRVQHGIAEIRPDAPPAWARWRTRPSARLLAAAGTGAVLGVAAIGGWLGEDPAVAVAASSVLAAPEVVPVAALPVHRHAISRTAPGRVPPATVPSGVGHIEPDPFTRELRELVTSPAVSAVQHGCLASWARDAGTVEPFPVVLTTVADERGLVRFDLASGDPIPPDVETCMADVLFAWPWVPPSILGEQEWSTEFLVGPAAGSFDAQAARDRIAEELRTAERHVELMHDNRGLHDPDVLASIIRVGGDPSAAEVVTLGEVD